MNYYLFLIISTDEGATERILRSEQVYANLCGVLEMTLTRDAFITALCKASLPPNYALTVLNMYPQQGITKGKGYYYVPPVGHAQCIPKRKGPYCVPPV